MVSFKLDSLFSDIPEHLLMPFSRRRVFSILIESLNTMGYVLCLNLLSILEPSCRVIITQTAWQGDVLRVGQTVLQRERTLGGGDQVWVGETELHREAVLKERNVRKTTLGLAFPLPWRCSPARCQGGGPRPSLPGSQSALRAAAT